MSIGLKRRFAETWLVRRREIRPRWRRAIARTALLLLIAVASAARGLGQNPPPAQATASAPGAAPEVAEEPAARPALSYMGRLIAPPMHFSGAGWLTRDSRVREESPAKLLKALRLKAGQVVCDFGCGNGYYTVQLAKRVGPEGKVYAIDIQQEMLDLLADRASPRGLKNIMPVLATPEDPGMPEATFDLILMVDVYHELSHPPEVLAAVRASLKPEGRLVLVEFREEDPTVPILPLHKMSQAQVLRELPPNGYKLVGQFDALPWQHVLEFSRDDSPLPAVELRPWQASD